jgi:hypothetical protein
MARRRDWSDLPKHLTDEVMNRVVPQGTYEEVPAVLTEWYSGLCTGLSLPVPADDEHDDQPHRVGRTVQSHPNFEGTGAVLVGLDAFGYHILGDRRGDTIYRCSVVDQARGPCQHVVGEPESRFGERVEPV